MSSSVPFTSSEPVSGDAVAAEDRKTLRMLWWLAIAGAVASVVLGVMVLVWPDATLLVGAVFFGAWLLVHGIIRIVQAVMAKAEDGGTRALMGIIGVLFVVAGVICLRNVVVSLLAIATIVGVTWLIGGIVELVSAFGSRYSGGTRVAVGVLGGITVIGGIIVLLWPGMTLLTLVYLTGIWLVVMGIVQFFLVVTTRPAS